MNDKGESQFGISTGCLIALLVVVTGIVGCSRPVTKIDGATEATFKESVDALRKPMSPKERKQFERGIQTIGRSSGNSVVPGAMTRDALNALDGRTPAEVIAAGNADRDRMIRDAEARLADNRKALAKLARQDGPSGAELRGLIAEDESLIADLSKDQ